GGPNRKRIRQSHAAGALPQAWPADARRLAEPAPADDLADADEEGGAGRVTGNVGTRGNPEKHSWRRARLDHQSRALLIVEPNPEERSIVAGVGKSTSRRTANHGWATEDRRTSGDHRRRPRDRAGGKELPDRLRAPLQGDRVRRRLADLNDEDGFVDHRLPEGVCRRRVELRMRAGGNV